MKQEPVDEGKNPTKRRLGGMIARAGRVGFYVVWLLLLLACTGAWILSFQGLYDCSVWSVSLHHEGKAVDICYRNCFLEIKDGEIVVSASQELYAYDLWYGPPKLPDKRVTFHAEKQSPDEASLFHLPQNGWHQFRYEKMIEPPDTVVKLIAGAEDSIGFPFWSAFVILLIPPLIWLVRRASRKVVENRRGFTPILKR